ncbi:hypothetical protein PQR62_12490 [Herbaspirillum lusitanum]|jgi:hypothetical protein|uniref:DUF4148 domain-containing protein n=1 Tax=Herbaspirillum lusitanum TaxID=213312 RepID=A0ABW9A8A1_9BURK
MNIVVIKKLGLAAILMLGLSVAVARPPEGGRPMPNQSNDFRHQGAQPQFGNGGGQRNDFANEQEAQRRGKLSPDERRELRRQINEAGQDIYRVKR